ncbi:bZIP transcription factor [Maribacter sp. 4G9]|uniref:bZIP transcription factor n=1 Tax=Maribacter sp. 4G9 TaxID=1889777 RepID=UPI000C1472EC|nr:bZIP transcription factor [Maribacter sp. 4G9]PIB29801.1 hypothetical protein BFP75_02835 [Maribacter sp. 4G9]
MGGAGGVATWAAPTAGAVISDATLDGDGQTGTPLSIAANSINSARIIDASINADDLADDSVETGEILNGTILNEDIAPGAAIDGSKINPIFTAQINATAGITSGADILLNGNALVPDYVFQKYFLGTSTINETYRFESLKEIEQFIKANNHLPGVTSAATAKKEGAWNLSKSNLQNLEKIEELFLHTIEQEKKIETLQEENQALSKELDALKEQVKAIQILLAKENE